MRRLILFVALCLLVSATVHAQLGDVLVYGTPVNGAITEQAGETRYVIEGAEGDIIVARMNATQDGLDSFLTLLDPSGTVIATDDDNGGNRNALLGPVRLPATGLYALAASSCCPGSPSPSTGTYALVVERIQPQPLAVGTPVTVELPVPDSLAVYALDITQPQMTAFDIGGLQGSGAIVLTANTAAGSQQYYDTRSTDGGAFTYAAPPMYVATPGTVLVTVRRDSNVTTDVAGNPLSGVTAATLAAQALPLTPVALNTAQSGTLDDAAPQAAFGFTADAGTLVALNGALTAPGGQFELYLTSPSGAILYSGATAFTSTQTFSIDPLQLNEGGQYGIVVRRVDGAGQPVAGQTSAYTFTVSGSTISTLMPGQPVAGTVEPSAVERTYRFDGTAGQRVRFTISPNQTDFAPVLFILGPELETAQPNVGIGPMASFNVSMSSMTSGSFTYETVLPVTGVYIVRVSNGLYSAEGPTAGGFNLLVETVGG